MTRFIRAIFHPSPRPCEHPYLLDLGLAQKHLGRCTHCNATVAKFGAVITTERI